MKVLRMGAIAAIAALCAAPAFGQKVELEYALPHDNCPTKYPTFDSVQAHCKNLEQRACSTSPYCTFSPAIKKSNEPGEYPATCDPKPGAHIASPSTDPSTYSGFFQLAKLMPEKKHVDMGKRAYNAAASKKYDDAISQYGRAIDVLKDSGTELQSVFRSWRGLAFEYKGDKAKAVESYCQSLVFATDWQSEEIARGGIVRLTDSEAEKHPVPIFQKTGIVRAIPGKAIARLKLTAPEDRDYPVKLRNSKSKREELLIYVQAGSTFETKIPLGTYIIRGANGPVYYGLETLFGEETKYFRLQPKDRDDELYPFVIDGKIIRGWEFKFVKQVDGNLLTPEIAADEF